MTTRRWHLLKNKCFSMQLNCPRTNSKLLPLKVMWKNSDVIWRGGWRRPRIAYSASTANWPMTLLSMSKTVAPSAHTRLALNRRKSHQHSWRLRNDTLSIYYTKTASTTKLTNSHPSSIRTVIPKVEKSAQTMIKPSQAWVVLSISDLSKKDAAHIMSLRQLWLKTES